MTGPAKQRVIVVGAGVSGLIAAYRMQEQGFDVTVLEAEDHVGGKTFGTGRDGFSINHGASILSAGYERTIEVIEELGLEEQLIRIAPTVGIVRDGRVHLLRGEGLGAVVDFLRTPVISWRSKLLLARAAFDAIKARSGADYNSPPQLRAQLDSEDVAAFCNRRLNSEIRDRFLEPLIGGIYLSDGERISVVDMFCMLNKFIKGMLGYTERIDFLARELAGRLDVVTCAPVSLLESTDTGAQVSWTQDGTTHQEHVAGVITSVTAQRVPEIYPGLDPAIAEKLNHVPQANYLALHLALTERPDLDAVLVCVPKGELGGLSTVVIEHNVAHGSAPPTKGLVCAFATHEWATTRLDQPDQEIIDQVLPQVERVLGPVSHLIEFAEVIRWAPAAPRPVPGYYRIGAELHDYLNQDHRIQLAGDFLTLPSVNGSVVSGEAAAQRLARTLRPELRQIDGLPEAVLRCPDPRHRRTGFDRPRASTAGRRQSGHADRHH